MDGTLEVGAQIPSTRQLEADYEASFTVVRRAVKELADAGVLHGQAGRGVFVRAKPDTPVADDVTVGTLAQRFGQLESRVDQMEASDQELARGLRADLREVKSLVAALEAHVIELYRHTGQPYPLPVQLSPAGTEDAGTQEADA